MGIGPMIGKADEAKLRETLERYEVSKVEDPTLVNGD